MITLVARSSSHFSRVARIFALELGVSFTFRPVLDLTSVDAANYAGNPALKVPILIDESGPLFGTENICRELVRRAGKTQGIYLRGDVRDRVVANAEELTLHVMTSEVGLITAKLAGDIGRAPPKVTRSIENGLGWLDDHIEAVLAALPAQRTLSFVEVALFCVVRHLPFREVLDVRPWARLGDFCAAFGARESAKATEYRFDTA